jgi:hypothetical protein
VRATRDERVIGLDDIPLVDVQVDPRTGMYGGRAVGSDVDPNAVGALYADGGRPATAGAISWASKHFGQVAAGDLGVLDRDTVVDRASGAVYKRASGDPLL